MFVLRAVGLGKGGLGPDAADRRGVVSEAVERKSEVMSVESG